MAIYELDGQAPELPSDGNYFIADTAMVIALAAASGGFKPCTTVDLTINFMRPIAKTDAILEAKVMRLGKTLAFCTCEIREVGGTKPAAFATGTYAILG